MRKRIACALLLSLGLAGCQSPVANSSILSPDKRHWVSVDAVPPDDAKDQLVPTVGLTLHGSYSTLSQPLVTGIETMCGSSVFWNDDLNVTLRVPADRADAIRVHDNDIISGIQVHVIVHEDELKDSKPSPDGKYRLIVVYTCETDDWNLYLRRAGEPDFNAAMHTGWDDPDLFGGYGYLQPHISLSWTGPRSAEIRVPGKRYGVTLRDHIGDVHVNWRFMANAKAREPQLKKLEPAKN